MRHAVLCGLGPAMRAGSRVEEDGGTGGGGPAIMEDLAVQPDRTVR